MQGGLTLGQIVQLAGADVSVTDLLSIYAAERLGIV